MDAVKFQSEANYKMEVRVRLTSQICHFGNVTPALYFVHMMISVTVSNSILTIQSSFIYSS